MATSGLIRHTPRREAAPVVVKSGGSLVDSDVNIALLCGEIASLAEDYSFVIVNGGGREIDRLCRALSIPVEKVGGLRITTPEVMSVVQMALAKSSNAVASCLSSLGVRAVPFPAFAAMTVTVEKRQPVQSRDLGLVGSVAEVDCSLINLLQKEGIVPVVYPVSADRFSQLHNVNADEIASRLASELGAGALLMLTDVEGVLVEGIAREVIRTSELENFARSGWITDGMLPKLDAAAGAALNGVSRVCILDGRKNGVIREYLKEGKANGTEIQK